MHVKCDWGCSPLFPCLHPPTMNADNIYFRSDCDGTITVDTFPDAIMVAREFLQDAHIVERVGFRRFRIVVSNGNATYRIHRKDRPGVYICTR